MSNLRHWDELADEARGPSVLKRVLPGSGASLVRLVIKAGTRAERHAHPFEQFVQVLSGTGHLETEDGMQAFRPGSLFHFLPNVWHAAVFESDTVLVETNLAPP